LAAVLVVADSAASEEDAGKNSQYVVSAFRRTSDEEGTQKPQKSKKALQLREFCVPSS